MQGMQLSSKMRFIAAQFDALFTGDLWLRSASHANSMARLLGDGIARLPGCRVTQEVQANEVFATIPREHIAALQSVSYFHVWNEAISEARFVCSFDTSEEEVTAFLHAAGEIIKGE
jgi:threonine aldolase